MILKSVHWLADKLKLDDNTLCCESRRARVFSERWMDKEELPDRRERDANTVSSFIAFARAKAGAT